MTPDPISFSEWMRRALFDPEGGYYARHIGTVGRRGDFSTSATLSTALGEAVASWVRAESASQPKVRTLIEVGGGTGALMRSLRRALGWRLGWKFRFFMVESSPVLRTAQEKTLAKAGVTWFSDLKEALQACNGSAFLYHNELLDAFPVTLVEWDAAEQSWKEIWLTKPADRWIEERRPFSISETQRGDFAVLASQPTSKTQRCELGVAARDWLRGWAPHWQAGAMLTLDYGDEFPALYHRRPAGTLRAYQAHQRFTGAEIYEFMGRRDITADVNFSDLRRWGEALGWQANPLETQREFLQKHLRDFEQRARKDLALAFLAEEHGAGREFKALVQTPRGRQYPNLAQRNTPG